jgi:hypothetical protein
MNARVSPPSPTQAPQHSHSQARTSPLQHQSHHPIGLAVPQPMLPPAWLRQYQFPSPQHCNIPPLLAFHPAFLAAAAAAAAAFSNHSNGPIMPVKPQPLLSLPSPHSHLLHAAAAAMLHPHQHSLLSSAGGFPLEAAPPPALAAVPSSLDVEDDISSCSSDSVISLSSIGRSEPQDVT